MELQESWMLPCLFKQLTDIGCPGCGAQRALAALLKGNLYQSFVLYPPLIPIIINFLYLGLYLKFPAFTKHNILFFLTCFSIIIIFLNFLLNLLHYV